MGSAGTETVAGRDGGMDCSGSRLRPDFLYPAGARLKGTGRGPEEEETQRRTRMETIFSVMGLNALFVAACVSRP